MTVTAQRRFTRHWKETRFNPDAEHVFIRRVRLGLPCQDIANPGDPVTEEIKQQLGRHRLRVWWNARLISSREGAILKGVVAPREDEAVLKPIGGGWFEVALKDGSVQRVRGKEQAQKLLNGD